MNDPPPDTVAGSSPGRPPGELLDSWKEIAAYLKRDVATVRRWEKREALPVHRHLHEKAGSVSAYTSELDAWADGRRQPPEQALRSVMSGNRPDDSLTKSASVGEAGVSLAPWRRGSVVALIAAALASGVLVLAQWFPRQPPGMPAPIRLSADLGTAATLARFNVQFGSAAVLSPDATVVVFVAQEEGDYPQLYVRRLDQLQAESLAGTDDANSPFFSPDGKWVGFFARGKLKKIALSGGAAVTLADATSNRGGSWSEDGTIVFSPNQTTGTGLLRVSSSGGAAEPVGALAQGEAIQVWPQVLPGGKAVLYTSSAIAGAYNDADLVVQVAPGGPRKVVLRGGFHGRYLPSGHLVYVHDGTLFATPFDLDRLELTGQPVPALAGVNANAVTGGAQFAASDQGLIVYLPGEGTGAGMPIQWMAPDGRTTPLLAAPKNWVTPRFAPNGRQLALEIRAESSDIWIYEWARGTLIRLTSGLHPARRPVWTPDGRRIAFASSGADGLVSNLYWQREDGTGEPERLTESPNAQQPSSWHPGGRFLAFEETTSRTKVDVMILPLDGDDASGWKPGKPTVFLNGAHVEFDPMFSPDGKWLAYSSMESGHPEVYVRPFPGPGGRWLIGAGANPTWSPTRRELFYGVNGRIMVARFEVEGDSFQPDKPREWSDGRYQTRGSTRMFDLHADGERFALASAAPESRAARHDSLVFIFNFFDELRRITRDAPANRSKPEARKGS